MAGSKYLITAVLLQVIIGSRAAPQATPVAGAAAPPATFTANPDVGPGGSTFKDSAHFRVYGNANAADEALAMLEGAFSCFVETLNFRSTGLSYNPGSDDGPYYKTNIYSVPALGGGAAGVMHSDPERGLGYVEVLHNFLTNPGVTIHEYGHALHYHQRTWVHQSRTGAWWETFATGSPNTYKTSELCADARIQNGQSLRRRRSISKDHRRLLPSSCRRHRRLRNYYEAWPSSPTSRTTLTKNSDETPLHTLGRVSTNTPVSAIVGRYWARMPYVDIGHPSAQEVFLAQRRSLNYANVDASGTNRYTVKAARAPKYMGANIIPLTTSGAGTVSVNISATGAYTATLVVYSGSAGTRYVVVDGYRLCGREAGEEVSLVIANTPEDLVLFDPFKLSSEVSQGLSYSFTVTGATA
ncbi:conserved hypothetical protein [Verticillium alfalfae VaMs.102]|uniref:Dockerin type 1 n=1 Tax=Verticillium alfalfae (strain VaMs.102 / ATCC MYA-4576 / FGSC 10136) TaxID=526221 RepID=C9SI38_VERA1|nr:conserved hypothetical protein [Verticillium alfalfae VaMs.102]EEY18611.1 conserved hypothetical protein [Verticillium alfalfae VaMs.102]